MRTGRHGTSPSAASASGNVASGASRPSSSLPKLATTATKATVTATFARASSRAAGVSRAASSSALLSLFASGLPDGLEWAVARATGGSSHSAPTGRVHALLARVQRGTAVLPDYDFAAAAGSRAEGRSSAGSSLSGVLGTVLTLVAALGVGPAIRRWRAR